MPIKFCDTVLTPEDELTLWEMLNQQESLTFGERLNALCIFEEGFMKNITDWFYSNNNNDLRMTFKSNQISTVNMEYDNSHQNNYRFTSEEIICRMFYSFC